MVLILNQNQQNCVSAAVALLKPANATQCQDMVEAYIERWIPVYEAPPRGNPTKARKELKALDSCITRYTKVMDSLDPAAEDVLHDALERLREAQELLVNVVPRLGPAADALSPRKQGKKVKRDQRVLANFCLELFEAYRPGEARPASGEFTKFVEHMYEAATDVEPENEELTRSIKWAYKTFCENNRRVPDLCDADA
jgi:hypothetical protein